MTIVTNFLTLVGKNFKKLIDYNNKYNNKCNSSKNINKNLLNKRLTPPLYNACKILKIF